MADTVKKLVCLIIVLALTGISLCSSGYDKAELMSALPTLIENGRELLEIVYGSGLPVNDGETRSVKAGYFAVSDDSAYKSIGEIEAAMSEVFSEGYTTVLYNTALSEITFDGDTTYPRYIEKDGVLYADITFDMQILRREPVLTSINILKANRFMAEIEITMKNSDGSLEKDTFLTVCENGKWKLDSSVL